MPKINIIFDYGNDWHYIENYPKMNCDLGFITTLFIREVLVSLSCYVLCPYSWIKKLSVKHADYQK